MTLATFKSLDAIHEHALLYLVRMLNEMGIETHVSLEEVGGRTPGVQQRMEVVHFMHRQFEEMKENDFYSEVVDPAIQRLALQIKWTCAGRALTFCDLQLPGGVDMAHRTTDQDGKATLRTIRAYDVNDDTFPTRFDVAFRVHPK